MKDHNFSYIWYPLTSFYEHDNTKIKYKLASKISPYFELNEESINRVLSEDSKETKEVDVNPFIRFNNIFSLINKVEKEEDSTLRASLNNLLLHYLGKIDLYVGQNIKDIYVKEIIRDIEGNSFGSELSEKFKYFKEYEKHMVADILYEMYKGLSMIDSFKKSVKLIFSDSLIYDQRSSDQNISIFLNYSEIEENIKKIDFLKEMFLPLRMQVDLFWEYHFGIIGFDVTMKIGEISIF